MFHCNLCRLKLATEDGTTFAYPWTNVMVLIDCVIARRSDYLPGSLYEPIHNAQNNRCVLRTTGILELTRALQWHPAIVTVRDSAIVKPSHGQARRGRHQRDKEIR
jgi:hypothetical protein